MSSDFKSTESPEGEIVYRRIPDTSDTPPPQGPQLSRMDPTLMPLLVGCALLLLFILVLGNLSVRRVEDTSHQVLVLEQQFAARANLLLQFRIALTRVDNEARDRMEAEARHEFRAPFDMRLNTAQSDLNKLIPLLDHLPLAELPKWRVLRDDLLTYSDLTQHTREYSLNGFQKFQQVDSELNEIIRDTSNEQDQIMQRSDALQRSAARSIRIWSFIAILAGLFVSAGTIWEVQRRYRQMRQSMDAARREREFSNQMLGGMVSAVAAIDRQDRIRSANATFFEVFPNAGIGSSVHDEIGDPEAMKVLQAATATHVDKSTYRGRWNMSTNGTARTFDIYSSPLEIDGERGQILTLVDASEVAKSEAALRRTESLAAVGEAAAQLAHEIKNPLGSIRLGVEMLRDHATSDDAVRTITLVERGIHHLNKLVVDVTQFSRRRALDRSETNLRDIIDSSIDLVADRIQEKEISVKKSYATTELVGNWDDEQLREVFLNLLANAIDASEPKSTVEVSTESIRDDAEPQTIGRADHVLGPAARIRIIDHGTGMDAKTQSRLFEPFFTTKKRGTGLGLSIVRQIIDLHNGTIDVESRRGKGTTFTIELPLPTA